MLKPIFTALALAAAIALPVQAQSAKIATIRSSEVAAQAPQFKTMQEKLKAEFERRQNDFEADMKRFQDDGTAFKKEADILAAGERAKKEKDLATRRIDLESKGRALQEEFGRRREQLMIETMGKLKTVIEQVAKEKGVAVVLENPVYAAPEYDITGDVVKRLQTAK